MVCHDSYFLQNPYDLKHYTFECDGEKAVKDLEIAASAAAAAKKLRYCTGAEDCGPSECCGASTLKLQDGSGVTLKVCGDSA